MRILSWNIQSGKGCDDVTDIYRTIEHIKSSGDFEIICVQEVARNIKEYCACGQMDQPTILRNAFSTYSAVWGSGFSWPHIDDSLKNQEFGNLTLIKNTLMDHKIHQLPMPAVYGKKQMPRVAIETIIYSDNGPVSVINTHLAYHDRVERQQQLERINLLEQERKKSASASQKK